MEKSGYKSERDRVKAGKEVTILGVLVNAFLILLKLIAGIFGQSQALIADAIHSVSDLFTDAVTLVGFRIGRKAPDKDHPFGHARIETLASAGIGLALVATALYIGINASVNIHRHTEYYPTHLALVGAALSIALKEALYHYTLRVGRRIRSPVILANAWHHRSDALSSVAVLAGVGAALIRPSWHILDAYAALFVSFFIVKVGLETIRGTLREFIDAAPTPEIIERITSCTLSVKGVLDIHDLRVRMSGGRYQMETHIMVDGGLNVEEGHLIAKAVETCLEDRVPDLDRVIVHVDPWERTTNGGPERGD